MGKKKIVVSLSSAGIDRAIKELEMYEREIERKTVLLRDRIAERLETLVKQGFSSATVDQSIRLGGRSPNVSVSIENREQISVVIASGEDAVWVEFGTGVFHNGSAGSSPHPKGRELGFLIGGYGQGKGKQKTWSYYDGGELRVTHGTPAQMPMYNAVKIVCQEIVDIAKEVFA